MIVSSEREAAIRADDALGDCAGSPSDQSALLAEIDRLRRVNEEVKVALHAKDAEIDRLRGEVKRLMDERDDARADAERLATQLGHHVRCMRWTAADYEALRQHQVS